MAWAKRSRSIELQLATTAKPFGRVTRWSSRKPAARSGKNIRPKIKAIVRYIEGLTIHDNGFDAADALCLSLALQIVDHSL
jgi:hypothetical protein